MQGYLLEVTQGTGTSAFDFSSIDLSSIVPTFMAAVAAGIGLAVTIVAIKKGINWLMSRIKAA